MARQKEVFSTEQIPHIWIYQRQQSARNKQGNFYFDGKKIFSYGGHFCIARILEDQKTVIFTKRTYSNTTAKHIQAVRWAIPKDQFKIVYSFDPESASFHSYSDYNHEFKIHFDTLANSRTRPNTKDRAKIALSDLVNELTNYWQAIGTTEKRVIKSCKNSSDPDQLQFIAYYESAKILDVEGLTDKRSKLFEILERKRRKEQKEKERENQEIILKWLQGENVHFPYSIDRVYLRAIGERVETSKGANVSIKSAKILFEMIKRGDNIRGHEIDGYIVIGINGVLTIGCHKIERSEIDRFAKSVNW